jgi:hypothetical protein
MIEFSWFQAYPPRNASLAEVTGMVRLLASRPRYGLRRLQPVVVFEVWVYPGRLAWLVGIEPAIARTLPGELIAQLPGLTLLPTEQPARPAPITGRELRLSSAVFPLRREAAVAVTTGLVHLQDQLHHGEAVVVQLVVGPSHHPTPVPVTRTPLDILGFTEARQPDRDELQAWKNRLGEPLLGLRARVSAVAGDARRAGELLRPTVSALALAGSPQARVYAGRQTARVADQLVDVMGQWRTWSLVVNGGELATLLGWCLGGRDVPGGPGPFAPPPAALQQAPHRGTLARVLGVSTHPATAGRLVWLPHDSYRVHTSVLGPSGRGKSTLLAQWILSEAVANGSLVVIEPKGDLVADVLARLPERLHDRVVVIDPGAEGPVVGFNPLAGPRDDAERRADSLLGLFRATFGTAIGPRSADVLAHALLMAARLKTGALTDLLPILSNPQFRHWAAAKVSDPLAIGPWLAWFNGLSDEQRTQVVMPIANKIRPFTSRPAIRRLLGQAQPKFDLGMIFDRPMLVLVNVNAGAIGPESSSLIGALILRQLWEAIQRQTTKPAAGRRPVSVVVDEWQTFAAGLDFADVLARARGANASFTLANQHLAQLNTNLQAAVLANVGTHVVFRPADGDGRTLARVLGTPVTPEDLERLPAYHAAVRALVDGAPGAAFEVATPGLPDALNNPARVRQASAARYGVDPAALDAQLLVRWQGGQPPSTPVGTRRTTR